MPSPTTLLVVLLLGLGLFGSGVSIGYRWERNAHLAEITGALNAVVEGANRAAETETKRLVAVEKTKANARLAARELKHQGELDALKKSRPDCARDPESMGLLNSAIRQANGEDRPAGGLRLPVRPAP